MDTIEECSVDDGRRLMLMGSRILVGVPNNSRGCSELLSWAIRVVARPNDSVVAVHVLGTFLNWSCFLCVCLCVCDLSCSSPCFCLHWLIVWLLIAWLVCCLWLWWLMLWVVAGGRGKKNRLQKANAFVIYMLGEFVETCEAKQVRFDRNQSECSLVWIYWVVCTHQFNPKAYADKERQTIHFIF